MSFSVVFEGQSTHPFITALKGLVEEQLRTGIISPEEGAGPGFIEFRRKTGNPLDNSFVKIDNEITFYIFTSTIAR